MVQLELEHDGVGRPRRGLAGLLPRRVDRRPRADFLTTAAPPLVGDDPFALEAIEERLEDVDGEAAGKAALDARAARLDRPAARRAALAPARPLARGAADVVHDRDRLDRRHARPRAPGARVPLAEDQGGRRRGPRAPRGRARGVGRAAARGRQRGLDARVGARADARADPARRGVRGAALPGRRPRLVPRPARAPPAPPGDRGRGLPRPARRGAGGRVRRRDQREAREVRRRARGCADDSRRPRPRTASDARLHGRVAARRGARGGDRLARRLGRPRRPPAARRPAVHRPALRGRARAARRWSRASGWRPHERAARDLRRGPVREAHAARPPTA